jgi:hypothetical protein
MAASRHSAGVLACTITLLGTSALSGQTIRGRVLDGAAVASGVPIAGAVIVLLDSLGGRVRGALSGSDGLFVIRAESGGTHRLRAEMIGRTSIESPIFAVRDSIFHTLVLPPEPIQLAGLDIESARRCSVRDQVARATHVVWEEAQKALRAESIVRQAAIYRFHVAQHERRLDADGHDVLDEKTRYLTQVNDDPFSTLAPDILARDGYVHEEEGDTWIYGPSTDVLLSTGFQDTHCFALRQERSKPGLVGLSFEPVPGRRLADIEGVLWLDKASAELRTLEFRYRNIPQRLLRGEYTGFASFRRLDNGAWIIEKWWLRSPASSTRRRVTSIREEAGEVIRIEAIR